MNHIIKGIVIRGDGYGRRLGFPTVNLDTLEKEFPPVGVYAGTALLEGENYRAGIVIGPRINNKNKIEAHLIGYDGDAYGKEVVLLCNDFLREYKEFNSIMELKEQIGKDIKQC